MLRTLAIALALLAPAAVAWAATTRAALLIGEGDYYHPPPSIHGVFWPKLANPPNDVDLVARKLRKLGFETVMAKNAGRAELEKKIAAFAEKAAKADEAVVYYAGHGFEYARHNYLVPVDAPGEVDLGHLDTAYIDIDEVARATAKAKRLNLFFLDACRTRNSFLTLTGDAKPYVDDVEFQPGTPMLVVYSTARGEEAFDHAETTPPPANYSPFAWYVAKDVGLPMSVNDVLSTVIQDVQASTKDWGPQSPYTLGSVPGVYYLRPTKRLDAGYPQGVGSSGGPEENHHPLPPALKVSLADIDREEPASVVAKALADHSPEQIAALARAGDLVAAYVLGCMFEYGRGVQVDPKQAGIWLQQVAVTQVGAAELELANLVDLYGEQAAGLPARALLEMAASHGSASAQVRLAALLMSDGASADYQKGLDAYRTAAAQNAPQALYALSVLKDEGARTKLAALAAGGDGPSRQWVCELAAAEGQIGRAYADCLAAAQAGFALSQARLALALHEGAGIAADPDGARHWARVALAQPSLPADLRAKVQAVAG